ncbi:MAG: N-acetylneuraminic acid synthase [Deltaproteobacteria bacterium]|nr:MAG: N-acetylneuraminic acid synthase [Deltaproteobacteria bacterium]
MSTQFVVEVSSNHNRDLERCLRFIDKAAEIGCDAVKFQLFKVEKLFASEILEQSEEHRRRKNWELPVEFLPELYARCMNVGIRFACTPFYQEAVDELLPYVSFYKIASYELLWKDLLVACAQTGKPVVLSTGMATLDEITVAVETLKEAGCEDLTLLHCVSSYPTPVSECNLAGIEILQQAFSHEPSAMSLYFGWSDHSRSPAVIYRAVHRWQAEMVEFHMDLDGKGEEFAAGHCWLPGQLKDLIKNLKLGLLADGSGDKSVNPLEVADRDWRRDPSDGLRPLLSVRAKM